MNLLDLADVKRYLGSIERRSFDNNMIFYNDVKIGNDFLVTIFAGNFTFCDPPLMFDNLLNYKAISIGLTEIIKGEQHDIHPSTDSRFQNFSWASYFNQSSKGINIAQYMGLSIPLEQVYQIIKDVYKISRLKVFY